MSIESFFTKAHPPSHTVLQQYSQNERICLKVCLWNTAIKNLVQIRSSDQRSPEVSFKSTFFESLFFGIKAATFEDKRLRDVRVTSRRSRYLDHETLKPQNHTMKLEDWWRESFILGHGVVFCGWFSQLSERIFYTLFEVDTAEAVMLPAENKDEIKTSLHRNSTVTDGVKSSRDFQVCYFLSNLIVGVRLRAPHTHTKWQATMLTSLTVVRRESSSERKSVTSRERALFAEKITHDRHATKKSALESCFPTNPSRSDPLLFRRVIY